MTILNRLLNADNECVGYFTDDAAGRAAMQAARAEWDAQAAEDWAEDAFTPTEYKRRKAQPNACPDKCRSIATPIKPLELEDVEPGDGDWVDYVKVDGWTSDPHVVYDKVRDWSMRGATSVDVRRHEINRYRRPGKSNRSADLGGPVTAAGVLYVLTVRAPKR